VERYVSYIRRHGYYSESQIALGTDIVDEAEKLCNAVAEQFPQSQFFAGQLVFDDENRIGRWFHNHTVFELQRRLYQDSRVMLVLPIKVWLLYRRSRKPKALIRAAENSPGQAILRAPPWVYLKIQLPKFWAQQSNPDGPATFSRRGSSNAFQVSWAEYRKGELPDPTTADSLQQMATSFGQKQGFGEMLGSESGDCTFGTFGNAVFRSAEYPRIQVWFISNGRDFIMATHICDREPEASEIAEVRQIASNLTLGPEEATKAN
jgi:hypothetical protein